MRDYVWVNVHPGTRKLRDGSIQRNIRDTEIWIMALKNHCRVIHRGKDDPNCPACKEIKEKLSESVAR
jgi:hypothetical protein